MRSLCLFVALIVAAAASSSSAPFTVSGLSSGAFVAVQLHVSFSSRVTGVGVVAGGPYYCAMDEVAIALTSCMSDPDLISLDLLYAAATASEAAGTIDETSNLAKTIAYLYSGKSDTVVNTGVVQKLAEFYESYNVAIKTEFSIDSEHGFPTQNEGIDCTTLASPFILRCQYDAASTLLSTLYATAADRIRRGEASTAGGSIVSIDQTKYVPSGWTDSSLSVDRLAYAFVPTACAQNTSNCSVHVAIHGCEQSLSDIGMAFVNETGYNQWAAAAGDLIVLYPQAVATPLTNEDACWDWWGYTNDDYATKNGPQAQMIVAMVDALQTNDIQPQLVWRMQ